MCRTNYPFQWRYNEQDGVSNHQRRACLLNRLFRRRSRKTSRLRVTGLFAENSPMAGESPAQRASNAENISIWWRHHAECCWITSTNEIFRTYFTLDKSRLNTFYLGVDVNHGDTACLWWKLFLFKIIISFVTAISNFSVWNQYIACLNVIMKVIIGFALIYFW